MFPMLTPVGENHWFDSKSMSTKASRKQRKVQRQNKRNARRKKQ